MPKDNTFSIVFDKFYQGFAPLAHLNSLTELGNGGHCSAMGNVDVISGNYLTQGPALSDLTDGTQAGAVSELINFIMDKAVTSNATYGIGVSKLFKISATAVSNAGDWPQAITSCTDGESVINLKGKLYYFFNKSSGAEIGMFDLSSTFDHDWGSTVPTGAASLQKALHPVAAKEDIMIFGNGRYLGTFIDATTTLAPTKLDFGQGHEVADVVFHANQWYVAVNSGVTGTNRNKGYIYLYEGAAVSTLLDDEANVGPLKIGFLMPINGRIWVAYQDLSYTGGYQIGYLLGRSLVPMVHFTGTLPGFHQKTLYKNTILFLSNSLVYSAGAIIGDLPYQVSQLADGGYATVGALAAPFGTPMIASSDGGSNHRLAKFSGFDTTCTWKSIIVPLIKGRMTGFIDNIIVLTKTLGASARCDLIVQYNQQASSSSTKQITTTSKRRHVFPMAISGIEDFNIYLNFANGNASNDALIRQIIVEGHFEEKA